MINRLASLSYFKIGLLLVLSVAVGSTAAGSVYPDVSLQAAATDYLRINYSPKLSGDFTTLGQADLIDLNGNKFWGRTLLIALPPEGDITFTFNFTRAGVGGPTNETRFISAVTPLVVRGATTQVRGHRLTRLHIFPQRIENNRLAAYTNFVIQVYITGNEQPADRLAPLSRLDTLAATAVVNPDQYYRFGKKTRPEMAYRTAVEMFDDGADWLKISIKESGVTRITGLQLQQAGINLTGLKSDSIRMFYAGGENPPIDPSAPEPELYQVGLRIEDGGDGFFGAADYILFYAEAANGYHFENGFPQYRKNHYGRINVYWVAVGGFAGAEALRWPIKAAEPSGAIDYVVNVTRQPVRAEQEKLLRIDSYGHVKDYYLWYWSDQPNVTATVNLPNLSSTDSLELEMTAVCNYTGTRVSINGSEMTYTGSRIYRDDFGGASSGLNTIRIDLQATGGSTYLDFLNIYYPMRLHLNGSQMEFNSYGYAGLLLYEINGYSSSNYTLDITDPDDPSLVSGVEIRGDTAHFQLPGDVLAPSHFVIYSMSSVNSPASVDLVELSGLRDDLSQYDCLVVSPKSFHGALSEYVDYRLTKGGYRVKLVAVEDIYNEFGFGLESPMAIRCYLKYAYENYNAPEPFAILLAGDGSYDYIDNTGLHAPSYIPPFIWSRSTSLGDDNYVYFGKLDSLDSDGSYDYPTDRGWDMMISRWPVRSAGEISLYINKLKMYESDAARGSWRSRITYVADDEFKGGYATEIIHTAQAETLAVWHTPVDYVKNKIYLTEYPFAASGEKPTVNDAIIKAVNDGTLILNYIGHGSPDVWADEHVLKKASDLSRMQNEEKPTVVIAASCSIGFFDAPEKEGMAETMFRQVGGAVAVVSATRLVYSTDNSIFNYDLYDALFGGCRNISEAVYTIKMRHQDMHNSSLIRNDRAYVVFGDPLGRLGMPEYRLEIESADSDTLTPLQSYLFSGTVLDEDDQPIQVSGEADITVYDSPIIREHELGISYSLGGPTLFRGAVEIVDGEFTGGFIVPLDIDYGGSDARISGYCSFDDISAIGGIDSLSISETVSTSSDKTGPEMSYNFEENGEFTSGDRIPANATLIVNIIDPSGINLTGGLGHRIELTIDGDNTTTVNLTDRFSYQSGSYQSGELRYTLPDMTSERHLFKLRAWDNANNPAVVEFEALPSEQSRIALTEAMNYPNPMSDWTEFYFDLSEPAEWVELQIFTLAGRMIKSFREDNPGLGGNRLFYWDGRDDDGDRIAEGVYIYKLSAGGRAVSGRGTADNIAETFGKLVLLN